MRSINLFFIIVLLSVSSFVFAGKGFDVVLTEGKSNIIYNLNYTLGNYSVETISAQGKRWSRIKFAGNVTTNKNGYAKLPFIHASIQLKAKDNVLVDLASSKYEDIHLDYPLLPSRGVFYRNQNPDKIPYVINKNSIKDNWYPGNLAKNSRPFILRDVRGTNIYVYPFQYNAQRKTLRVYKNMVVRVLKGRGVPVNPIREASRTVLPEMEDIYSSIFINYERTELLPLKDFGKLMVIYTAEYKDAIAAYITWKKKKGFTVVEKQVEKGINAKNIIKEAYQNDNKILYVQLVGDWDDIKSDTGPSSAPTDPMLGCVEGNDYYADIIVGRFSANNPDQVRIQVEKTIAYERDVNTNDSWYKNAIGLASSEGGGGQGDDNESDEQHMRIIKANKLLKNNYVEVHEGYATSGVSSRDVGSWIESGVGFINYVGHGSKTSWATSNFKNSDIGRLNNGNMLPFIVSVACVNGQFHTNGDSFAEAWLKKEGGGAVATWMSTINQPWAPPMRGQDYFNDLLIGGYNYGNNPGVGTNTKSGRTTFGSLTMNAAYLMYSESSEGPDLDTIQTWTIFGDSTLQVRSNKPLEISTSNKVVLIGIPFETTITDDDGAAVEKAVVSLYQNGNTFVGITNESGKVTIEHTLEVGNTTLTITGFNKQTISNEIKVIPPDGPYIVVNNYMIVDENNSSADTGETVYMSIELENVGGADSRNLKMNLEVDENYIENVYDSEEQIVEIKAGQIITIRKAFKVKFKKGIVDQAITKFKLIITDHTGKNYQGMFSTKINAPVFEFKTNVLGDNEIQPGDNRSIRFIIKNIGHLISAPMGINLSESSGLEVTINNPSHNYPSLAVGEEFSIDFDIDFSSEILTGSNAIFLLAIIEDGIEHVFTKSINVGLTDTFESGDFSANPWEHGGKKPWTIDHGFPYLGNYAAKCGSDLGRNGDSELILVKDFSEDGSISFFKRVSSESKYDQLIFYIDGNKVGAWSGEVQWSEEFYNVPAGLHRLKWVYKKDYSVDVGDDAAWIDNLLIIGL